MKNQIIIFALVLFCLAINQVSCDIPTDLVTGIQLSNDAPCGFPYTGPWYSGYLTLNKNQGTHYWFFPSQNDPKTDPVLLWLNGGPGCSSLLGAGQENGPFYFLPNSVNMEFNAWSWNKNASVLYLESPPGVGFSYTSTYNFNDTTVAQLNYQSLQVFFNQTTPNGFNEYINNQFFISGESYGGVYVPTLAALIVQMNSDNPQQYGYNTINLQGIAVGNGCTSPDECNIANPDIYKAQVDYFFNMGFMNYTTFEAFQTYCGSGVFTPQCNNTQQLIYGLVSQLNIYDVFGYCFNPAELNSNHKHSAHFMKKKLGLAKDGNLKDIPPCTDAIGPMTCYNNATIQAAMHIPPQYSNWSMCSDQVGNDYTRINGSYYLYPQLISAGVRIWIYSGDTDGAVPISGTLTWIKQLKQQLGLNDVEFWRPWFYDGVNPGERQNGGSYWKMDKLTFVRFKGVGHMVPQYNRQGALDMINAFLFNYDLPSDFM